MNPNWDIQELRLDWRPTKAQEREAVLRPLARLIARRLMAEGLAKPETENQTKDAEKREARA